MKDYDFNEGWDSLKPSVNSGFKVLFFFTVLLLSRPAVAADEFSEKNDSVKSSIL